MQNDDFYTSPRSNLETDENAREDVKAFSLRGRIGRTHYIVFTMGFTILAYIAMTAFVMLVVRISTNWASQEFLRILPTISTVFVTLCLLPVFFMTIVWTIRRCHDFNITGWLALILFVPLTPLLFWLIPGSAGTNNYGKKPVSGPRWGLVLILVPIIAGIVAAIAIPAYQGYVERADLGVAEPL